MRPRVSFYCCKLLSITRLKASSEVVKLASGIVIDYVFVLVHDVWAHADNVCVIAPFLQCCEGARPHLCMGEGN